MANDYQIYTPGSTRISSSDMNRRGEDLTEAARRSVASYGGSNDTVGGVTTITMPDATKAAFDFEVDKSDPYTVTVRTGRWILNGDMLTSGLPLSGYSEVTLPDTGLDDTTVSIVARYETVTAATVNPAPTTYTFTVLSGERMPEYLEPPDLWVADVSYNVNGIVHDITQVQEGPRVDNIDPRVNFKVTVRENDSGNPTAYVGPGYVTSHDNYASTGTAVPVVDVGSNPRYWGNATGVEYSYIADPTNPIVYPTNPERVNGKAGGLTSITYGSGFTGVGTDNFLQFLPDLQTAQIYLAYTTIGPAPDTSEVGESIISMEFVADNNVAGYRQPFVTDNGSTQTVTEYILIASIVAYDSALSGEPAGTKKFFVHQIQTDPIDVSAFSGTGGGAGGNIPPGDNLGDMLVWSTSGAETAWVNFPVGLPGQALHVSPVDADVDDLQEWRYHEFAAHAKVGDNTKLVVEAGTIVAPYTFDGDNYQTTLQTELTLTLTNFIYCEVHGVATPEGWMLVTDGITGAETSYPKIKTYSTVQNDYIPAGATDGSKVFRLPIALADKNVQGDITDITQIAGGEIYFNKDSTASALRYIFYRADEADTPFETDIDDILSGYNPATMSDWSLQFTVLNGEVTGFASPKGNVNTQIHNADAGATTPVAQTYYRIPIIRGGLPVSMAGAYRENTYCSGSKGPVIEFVKRG